MITSHACFYASYAICKPCLFFYEKKKYDGYWLLVMCFTCVYLSCVEIGVPLVGDGNMKTTFYFG